MQKVEETLQKKGCEELNRGTSLLENDPEYYLIKKFNSLSMEIEEEVVIVRNYIREKYWAKFPELGLIVHDLIDYARVVRRLVTKWMSPKPISKGSYLGEINKVVSVTSSTTTGQPLPEEKVEFDTLPSNLSAVAVKIMVAAGGITKLSRMPSNDILLFGAKNKYPANFSTAEFRLVFITNTAHSDLTRGDPSGEYGSDLRGDALHGIEKWKVVLLAKQPTPKKKKGGDPRHRELKERYDRGIQAVPGERVLIGMPQ
ncbi:hypothetical protein TIFTF001_024011 [Ficus carica]|uniref:Nop domain-containing protein n=1 Tax=Ficus carica TaxID=3494 RepID=A0AA88DEC1_FICCA|nr:hypothetical protein TIFTF001_024011 [Ficus carica]